LLPKVAQILYQQNCSVRMIYSRYLRTNALSLYQLRDNISFSNLVSDPNESINHIDLHPQELGSRIEAYNGRNNKHLARLFKWDNLSMRAVYYGIFRIDSHNSINNHA
jgi:hypothetical protein